MSEPAAEGQRAGKGEDGCMLAEDERESEWDGGGGWSSGGSGVCETLHCISCRLLWAASVPSLSVIGVSSTAAWPRLRDARREDGGGWCWKVAKAVGGADGGNGD